MTEATKTQDFEETMSELEKVVGKLESELKLEDALALFERGLTLSQSCEKYLNAAEQRIEILRKTATGAITVEPFLVVEA